MEVDQVFAGFTTITLVTSIGQPGQLFLQNGLNGKIIRYGSEKSLFLKEKKKNLSIRDCERFDHYHVITAFTIFSVIKCKYS